MSSAHETRALRPYGSRLQKMLGMNEMRRSLQRLLPYVWKYRSAYTALGLLLFVDIGITLAFAWFIKQTTDAAMIGELGTIAWLMLLAAATVVLSFITDYYQTILESDAVNLIKRDLKNVAFGHILLLPAHYCTDRHSGDLVSRLTTDIEGIEGAVGANLINLIRMPLLGLAAFLYLLSIHWQLAILCASIAPAGLLIAGIFGHKIRGNRAQLQQLFGRVNALLHDVFAGFTVMRIFGMERKLADTYDTNCNDVLRMERREARLLGLLQAGSGMLSSTVFFIGLGSGAYFVAGGAISVGELLAFVTLIQYLIYPFSGIARQWGGLQRSLASCERIWHILDEKPEQTQAQDQTQTDATLQAPAGRIHVQDEHMHAQKQMAPALRHGIAIEGLSFRYTPEKPVLHRAELYIPAGSAIAIVGPSGAGKSTLFQLLAGLRKPDEGSIRFDEISLASTVPEMWRSYLAYVPQEPYLFAGSIRDNIAGGCEDPAMEAIIEAAKQANAHEFIAELPDGYDTIVGERGADLSGGQRQRITIARALLKNAPILLLDEATSALDQRAEAAVQEALAKLKANRTVLMIAHSRQAIRQADRIVAIERGRLIEDSTPGLAQAQEAFA